MLLRWIRGLALAAVIALPGKVGAQVLGDAPLAHGTLAFDARATLGAFTGVTSTMTGAMTGASVLSNVRGWVEAASKSLTTSNGHRDRDMAGSLEIEKFPVIRFDLDSVASGETHGDSIAVLLKGRFTLHGQTHAASVPGFAWVTETGARVRGALPINVKDYGIGGLSKLLGMLKMNEMIVVRMDVTFGR